MPSTIIDSAIFGNIFSSAAMRKVFSDENRTQKYLDIEAALARVQARLGIIPAEAADEIVKNCTLDRIDMTQDITDTATMLQIREALALVDDDLQAISRSMANLAQRHRDTPMVGRSNLQQAVPLTFGYKIAGLLSAIERHRARLAELRPRVLVGEFAGAVGTLASIQKGALETQAGLMQELGLGQPDIAWHTQRDRIAEVGCFLGLVTGTLGKLATDVKLMMQTEVAEVYEPFAPGRGSSSTMPQKRNPIASCYIHACASVVRQHAAALLDAMIADHERSTGPWEIEWISLPEAFLLSAGALGQARSIVGGLEVDVEHMRANLDMTHGLVVSEAVMMGLAPYLGREHAHDLVYDLCRKAIDEKRPLLDLLAETPEITRHVDRKQLQTLCDPANYLGLSGSMVDRVLASVSRPEDSSKGPAPKRVAGR
ncbi:MAG: adenylosuccinate lyase family protein [Betaproteobacteria bacterium]|nr:MAG: adenylosuccinate lyase family protein [Betaproteobacteria bacterium]